MVEKIVESQYENEVLKRENERITIFSNIVVVEVVVVVFLTYPKIVFVYFLLLLLL